MGGAREGTTTFPRSCRLLVASDFRRAFGPRGSRLRTETVTAAFSAGRTDEARLGLAVPRKAFPRAVDRNRFKRIARESFRHHRPMLAPYDVVIRPARGLNRLDGEAIRRDLERVWLALSKDPSGDPGLRRRQEEST